MYTKYNKKWKATNKWPTYTHIDTQIERGLKARKKDKIIWMWIVNAFDRFRRSTDRLKFVVLVYEIWIYMKNHQHWLFLFLYATRSSTRTLSRLIYDFKQKIQNKMKETFTVQCKGLFGLFFHANLMCHTKIWSNI